MKNNISIPKMIVIVLLSLLVLTMGVIILSYYWVIPIDEPDDNHQHLMRFTLEDGENWNDTVGCFFKMQAGMAVKGFDPKNYTFLVSEFKDTPLELDFNVRAYDEKRTPLGGDRNSTCDFSFELDEESLSFGYGNHSDELWDWKEYIGFDMPKKEMGIKINDQGIYEVQIIDPKDKLIFKDTFIYSAGRGELSNKTTYPIHLWITNQGYPQYSNISVWIDNIPVFNGTAIAGNGHTYYFKDINLTSGLYTITVLERDSNTTQIIDYSKNKEISEYKDFTLEREMWISVSFWYSKGNSTFQVNLYNEKPGIS